MHDSTVKSEFHILGEATSELVEKAGQLKGLNLHLWMRSMISEDDMKDIGFILNNVFRCDARNELPWTSIRYDYFNLN